MSLERAINLMHQYNQKMNDMMSKEFEATAKVTADAILKTATGDVQKPPLGACPYYIVAEDRIHELTAAIERSNALHNSKNIKQWAKEIILQCDLIEEMK